MKVSGVPIAENAALSIDRVASFNLDTEIAIDLGWLVPQPLEAVTFRLPDVAVFEKLTSTELPVPVIVTPRPE